jgi:hypothetical protein
MLKSNRAFDRRKNRTGTSPKIHPEVKNWQTFVISRHGVVTPKTLLALDWFYRKLKTTSIFAKIKSLNCLVPDNFIAASIPLIANFGNKIWTNSGFVNGDISSNGLAGGTSKSLDTGMSPSVIFANIDTGGMTAYIHTYPTTDAEIGGVFEDVYNNSFRLFYGQTSFAFHCYDGGSGQGNLSGSTPPLGYFSANRTSSSVMRVFTGSLAAGGHRQLASAGQATIGGLSVFNISVMKANVIGAPLTPIYFDGRVSFFAVHDGLTTQESAIFYYLIQTLRQKLGGGFQ